MSGTTSPLKTLASTGICLTLMKLNSTISRCATSIRAKAMNHSNKHSLQLQLPIKLLMTTTDGKLIREQTRLSSKLLEHWLQFQLPSLSSLENIEPN